MSKTIQLKINKRLLKNLLKSIIISFLIIFVLEHFGKIEYSSRFENARAIYHTFFDGEIYSGSNFLTANKYPNYGDIETYTDLLSYRILAIFCSPEDFVVFLILAGVIWLIFILKQYVRVKIE